MNNWRPIYKLSSLPYNTGEEFYARYNNCNCDTEEPYIQKCLATRPCIVRFVVLNDLSFHAFYTEEKKGRSPFSKQALVSNFKYWKFANKDILNRNDIFVCKCKDACVLNKNWPKKPEDDKYITECCHCRSWLEICSDTCVNKIRGK